MDGLFGEGLHKAKSGTVVPLESEKHLPFFYFLGMKTIPIYIFEVGKLVLFIGYSVIGYPYIYIS
jgi:hypothetical protein